LLDGASEPSPVVAAWRRRASASSSSGGGGGIIAHWLATTFFAVKPGLVNFVDL
jgi:hypothetical protein